MFLKNKKILFLGFKNDVFTENAIDYLIKKKINIKVHNSKNKIGTKLPKSLIKNYDFLFSFKTKIILKKELLNKIKFFSINFHTGPYKYAGIGSVSRAIINDDKKFGITIHLMNEKIDNGRIITSNLFRISPKNKRSVENLLKKTYSEQLKYFKIFIDKLNKYGLKYIESNLEKNKKLNWGKKFKLSDLEKLKLISFKSSPAQLERIVRATSYKKNLPYILYKNKKIFLK